MEGEAPLLSERPRCRPFPVLALNGADPPRGLHRGPSPGHVPPQVLEAQGVVGRSRQVGPIRTAYDRQVNPDHDERYRRAKLLQALIGGSVDVVTGAYEHTIRMQAKRQDVRAVVELGRFPAVVIAARKDRAGEIKSAADLKGKKIGVTAPGSSTALIAQYAMVKAGQKPTDAPLLGSAAGRVQSQL